MANRDFNPYTSSLEEGLVEVFAQISFGASGAPTLQSFLAGQFGQTGQYSAATTTAYGVSQPGAGGVATISQSGTGDYILTLQDQYTRLLGLKATWANASGIPTISSVAVKGTPASQGNSNLILGGTALEFITAGLSGSASGLSGTAAGQTFSVTSGPAVLDQTTVISGLSGTSAGQVVTFPAAGAGIAANQYAGGFLFDGANTFVIQSNMSSSGTSVQFTVAAGPAPASMITGSGTVAQLQAPVAGTASSSAVSISGSVVVTPAAANPASGDFLYLTLLLSNSSVPN